MRRSNPRLSTQERFLRRGRVLPTGPAIEVDPGEGLVGVPRKLGWSTLVMLSEFEMPESLAGFSRPEMVNGAPVTVAVSVRLMLEPSVPTTWIKSGKVDEVWEAEVAEAH